MCGGEPVALGVNNRPSPLVLSISSPADLGVSCDLERKRQTSNKLVPWKDKQPSQIGILQQLAISLVTSLIPTRSLTALNMDISLLSNLMGSVVVLQRHNTRIRSTSRIDSKRLPSFHSHGML
jgi:hypothetical protein